MGTRNPYRISVDAKNGYLYWGEVGPDAPRHDTARGPMGYDEINQAKSAGNYGYPFFIADNYPYRAFDYATGKSGAWFDAANPVNSSCNNTGISSLPPAQPAMIWYPYGTSYESPQLGSGGRTAMAGPVYYADQYPKAKNRLPAYYHGKLFIYDWVRGWIKAVTLDGNGNFYKMEPFMAGTAFNAPVDMELGPDGKLYVLEYGKGWFSKNADAALSRIDYGSTQKSNVPATAAAARGGQPAVDSAAFKAGHQQKTVVHPGLAAIKKSDCLTCHKPKERSIGPSFTVISEKYAADDKSAGKLINKIMSGGSGVWGNIPMPAHPALSREEAHRMVEYILSLK